MAEEEENNQGRRKQARRELAPRSDVWQNFTRITDDSGNFLSRAKCNSCANVFDTNHGTSSMRKHFNKFHKQGDAAVGARATQLPPSPPPPCDHPPCPSESSHRQPIPRDEARHQSGMDEEEATRDLARMIALHGYDPSVVEDDYFRSFVRRLNPQFEVPSRVAIEEVCDGIFDEARRDSLSKLRRASGRLSFAVGNTKTIEAGEVIYIACHFIDDQWNLHKVVMDVLVPQGHHYFVDGPILGVNVTSTAAADVAMDVISDYDDRLSVVACDDTSNIRNHHKLKNYIEEVNSYRSLNCTTTTYVDNVLHSIAKYILPHKHFDDDMYEDMENLNLTRQERMQLLSKLGLHYKWAYDEHWCACYYSLEVLCKRGFTELVKAEIFIELLCKVWEQAYHSIQRISASTCPTSNLCLAELLKLREILQSELARFSGDNSEAQDRKGYLYYGKKAVDFIRQASDTLDEAIQDSYLVWSVPLALDPRYKLRYIESSFKRAFGSEAAYYYVSEVTTKINKLYADYIEEYGTDNNAADHSDSAQEMVATTSADDPFEQTLNEHCRSQDVMATQVNSCYPAKQTELDRYLQDPLAPRTNDFDILKWWKDNSWNYSTVALMARDALAMPTCSKLSSDQIAQVKSILRGYSKKPYRDRWRDSDMI